MGERLFYRVSELSDVLGCSKSKAYALVASGVIASCRVGGLLRVPRQALEAIAAHAMGGAGEDYDSAEELAGRRR